MKVRDFIKTMDPEQEIILFKGNSTLNGIWRGCKNDDITDDILDYKVENVKASTFADRHLVLFVFVSAVNSPIAMATFERYILENASVFEGVKFNKDNTQTHFDKEIVLPRSIYNNVARGGYTKARDFADSYIKPKTKGEYVRIWNFGDKSYQIVLECMANYITKATGRKM